jgi:hypothetical protein
MTSRADCQGAMDLDAVMVSTRDSNAFRDPKTSETAPCGCVPRAEGAALALGGHAPLAQRMTNAPSLDLRREELYRARSRTGRTSDWQSAFADPQSAFGAGDDSGCDGAHGLCARWVVSPGKTDGASEEDGNDGTESGQSCRVESDLTLYRQPVAVRCSMANRGVGQRAKHDVPVAEGATVRFDGAGAA